jgi:outer membrane protein
MKLRLCIPAALIYFIALSSEAAEPIYTLEDAYQSALSTNEVVKISEENVVQSGSKVDQAWSYLYPRITGQASYTRYNEVLPPGSDSGFIFQPLTQFQAALVLLQPLYTGGRTLAGLRTAQINRESSSLNLSSTRQDIMLDVAEAYYSAIKAQKMVEKSKDSVKRMEHHKQVTEREASTRKTKANVSNLLRARTLVSQAYITLTRDENNLRIARQKLTFHARLPDSAILLDPSPESMPADSFEQLKQLAFENRDDYAASILNEKIAEENITIVKGSHYPQVFAEAVYRYTNADPATMIDGNTFYGGLRLEIPIFEGGLVKGELAEARSKQRQSVLSQQHLRYFIESEVYEAYVNYQTITSVFEAAGMQYQDAKSNFEAIQNLFDQGLVASLALIDAQQALFLAEREYVNAMYDRQLSVLRLRRSIGALGKQI